MTTQLMWPEWVLRPADVSFNAMPMTSSGGASPTGSEQIVGNSPGRYRLVLKGVTIRTADEERIWRAISLNLGGRSGVIMVPTVTRRTAPWPTIARNAQRSFSKVALTDAILFSNGAGLYQRTILAQAASTIAAGAVQIDIALLQGSSLQIGQTFQAGESVYTITKIVSVDDAGDHPVFTVKFMLPARAAITSGDDLEFDNPRFRARLEADDGMAFDLSRLRFSSTDVAFVEDV